MAQAVAALIESFAEPPAQTAPTDGAAFSLQPADDEDLLVTVLDEAIYQMEVHGRVPIDTSIDVRTGIGEGCVDVRFASIPIDQAASVGAVPKAVSLHGLSFTRAGGGWHAHVTIDV